MKKRLVIEHMLLWQGLQPLYMGHLFVHANDEQRETTWVTKNNMTLQKLMEIDCTFHWVYYFSKLLFEVSFGGFYCPKPIKTNISSIYTDFNERAGKDSGCGNLWLLWRTRERLIHFSVYSWSLLIKKERDMKWDQWELRPLVFVHIIVLVKHKSSFSKEEKKNMRQRRRQ